MTQFDIYHNNNTKTKKTIPYLLDVQTDLLKDLDTRVIIPLILANEITIPLKKLNLPFEIENKKVMMLTQALAGISVKSLGKKATSIKHHRSDIINAIDFLLMGF